MKWVDPIVEEVRRARDAYAAQFDYDLVRMFEDLQKREQEHPERLIKTEPKPRKPKSDPHAARNENEPIYCELVDFIAGGSTPEEVIRFRPSSEARKRVAELLEREKESHLTASESADLHHFLELEYILRMAKAKARQILAERA
jgi:hypothetical protein